jgi:hypothetical protein
MHPGDLAAGTLRSILRQAHLTVEELKEALYHAAFHIQALSSDNSTLLCNFGMGSDLNSGAW